MRSYEYRHRVAFEDTNLVGNVYYANHVRWQGRCREMFLHEHAPAVIEEMRHGLALVTTRVACTYHQELQAFDDVVVRMRAGALTPSRLTMRFDYVRVLPDGGEELVAEGEQEVACLRREGTRHYATAIPEPLRAALAPYLETAAAPAGALKWVSR